MGSTRDSFRLSENRVVELAKYRQNHSVAIQVLENMGFSIDALQHETRRMRLPCPEEDG